MADDYQPNRRVLSVDLGEGSDESFLVFLRRESSDSREPHAIDPLQFVDPETVILLRCLVFVVIVHDRR